MASEDDSNRAGSVSGRTSPDFDVVLFKRAAATSTAQPPTSIRSMPASFMGEAHSRFVVASTLLSLIDPVRGESTTHSLDRHPHDDIWRNDQLQKKFLDSFALVSSTSRTGADTAAAVCLEQGHPSGTILRLARNLGVPKDLAGKLQEILDDLTAVAMRGILPRMRISDENRPLTRICLKKRQRKTWSLRSYERSSL